MVAVPLRPSLPILARYPRPLPPKWAHQQHPSGTVSYIYRPQYILTPSTTTTRYSPHISVHRRIGRSRYRLTSRQTALFSWVCKIIISWYQISTFCLFCKIRYVVYADFKASSATNIGFADMINPFGNRVTANTTTIQAAMLYVIQIPK